MGQPLSILIKPTELQQRLSRVAFAFRGYNITNLGRTAELLAHCAYRSIIQTHLDRASATVSDTIGRRVDLVARVREDKETTLDEYPEAVALIAAMAQAQLECLEQVFAIRYRESRLAFGYSLGEIS